MSILFKMAGYTSQQHGLTNARHIYVSSPRDLVLQLQYFDCTPLLWAFSSARKERGMVSVFWIILTWRFILASEWFWKTDIGQMTIRNTIWRDIYVIVIKILICKSCKSCIWCPIMQSSIIHFSQVNLSHSLCCRIAWWLDGSTDDRSSQVASVICSPSSNCFERSAIYEACAAHQYIRSYTHGIFGNIECTRQNVSKLKGIDRMTILGQSWYEVPRSMTPRSVHSEHLEVQWVQIHHPELLSKSSVGLAEPPAFTLLPTEKHYT